MDRINGAGHVGRMFVTEDAATNRPPTEITDEWLNGVQEEILGVIEDQLTEAGGDLKQMVKAIKMIFQKAAPISAAASGTVDAITANFTPAITALSNHLFVIVRAAGANTTATPTFTPNSAVIPPVTVVKGHNQPLAPGDFSGAGFRAMLQYDETTNRWVLLNPATGIGAGYMLIQDQKASGAAGGTSAAGATATRTLNTVVRNTITGASLAANQFTLPAGTYRIRATAPSQGTNRHRALLYNVTDAAYVGFGTSENANDPSLNADGLCTTSVVLASFAITASKVYELRHYTELAAVNYGFGQASLSGQVEVYSTVEIVKES